MEFPLIQITKRCLRHGITWTGPAFIPLSEDEATTGYRLCPCERCVDQAELHLHLGDLPAAPVRHRPSMRDLQLPAEVDTPPHPTQLSLPAMREPGED